MGSFSPVTRPHARRCTRALHLTLVSHRTSPGCLIVFTFYGTRSEDTKYKWIVTESLSNSNIIYRVFVDIDVFVEHALYVRDNLKELLGPTVR